MERSSRRDRSHESDEDPSSDTGSNTRLRSRRMRDTRSSTADSTSDGADTDASSAGQNADAPQRRQRHCNSTRKTSEEPRKKSARNVEEQQLLQLGDDEDEEEEEEEEEDVKDTAKVKEDDRGRERSMSIASNKSSTSSSSLVSEQMTGEQQRARLDQQVAELEQKKKMVEDGTLAEFCRRVAAFKEERNRLLQTAELHKNLQLKNGQDLYQFEVQRAHHLWQHDRKKLQEELLTKVDAFMAKLQVEMKALSEPGVRISGACKKPPQKQDVQKSYTEKPSVYVTVIKDDKGKSQSATEPQQEEGEVLEPSLTIKGAPVVKRRKMDPLMNAEPIDMSKLLSVEVVRLPFDEASADITAIVGERKEAAKSTVERLPNKGNLPFKLERRRLFCGKYIFEDGDEVQVSMPLVHEDYTGTVSSITDDAIYIKLASGQKARIFLPHLERRRCELKPLLRGIPSTGSLHSMGWSEYDTFY
ncbi:unnamed protein product [Peronospora farinosa]|uniref:Uncharacterized protein n=2 Tax=Peronospora farinosa TaxID=134698 RepID=A0AAV0TKA4_9STRA|nr:unnamed protein product [Peronospora farinosa]